MTILIRTAIIFVAVMPFIFSAGCSQSSPQAVQEADRLNKQAFSEYTRGSFESASNALMTYTAYLDANEIQITSHREDVDVDLNGNELSFSLNRNIAVTQFSPHSMLACMMIYSANTNAALHHLSRAYPYHVQIWARAQQSPVSRKEFVQFVLDGREKIDAKTGAAWKTLFRFDSNVVDGITAAWLQQPQTNN